MLLSICEEEKVKVKTESHKDGAIVDAVANCLFG